MQFTINLLRAHTHTQTHTNTHTLSLSHIPHTHLIVCLSVRGDLSFPTMRKRGRWLGRRCYNTGMWQCQLRGRRSPSVNRHLRACRKEETHKQKQTSVKPSGPVACPRTHYVDGSIVQRVTDGFKKWSCAACTCILTSPRQPHRRLTFVENQKFGRKSSNAGRRTDF